MVELTSEYNRKGFHCSQCIDGYGPAAFSDSITCADCSKYGHLWILNLLFQLTMVTVMYIIVILFQIKGTNYYAAKAIMLVAGVQYLSYYLRQPVVRWLVRMPY